MVTKTDEVLIAACHEELDTVDSSPFCKKQYVNERWYFSPVKALKQFASLFISLLF